jgi:signal transduction histidine kinase
MRSYEQLKALERLRDDLVHMVVHDMRSPLMAMMGHLSLVQAACGGALGDSAQDVQAAVTATRALSRMADDLLDVSKLEQGKLPLDRARHDLSSLAVEVRGALRALDPGREIAVVAPAPATALCDAKLMRRVLENLLGNAIKHTPEHAGVLIDVALRGDVVRVAIEDEGPGVPVEARERIFEKFGTVEARKSEKYHSAGLGLAFCKLAVAAHGGSIGVDAREPRGSVFWFELPREGAVTAA